MPTMQQNLRADKKTILEIVTYIKSHVKRTPTVAIICGSGLGKLAEDFQNPITINYSDIPKFPNCSVAGHHGRLVFGDMGGKYVMAMQGRFHFYEGYSYSEILIPIRVMKLMGVTTLLIGSATGGLNRAYKLGDLMIIKDHISLPSLALKNILVGPNDQEFGERFVALSDAYSSRLRKLFKSIATEAGHEQIIREGVYAHVGGPTYETPAECRMLLQVGSDVVGMSTAPEVIAARHAGIEVFAIALVTNVAVLDQESVEKANHQEVLEMAERRATILQSLFAKLIEKL